MSSQKHFRAIMPILVGLSFAGFAAQHLSVEYLNLKDDAASYPERVFLRLTGAEKAHESTTCRPLHAPQLTALSTAEHAASPIIPPYLMEQLRLRNPNDKSILATIQKMSEIEEQSIAPISYANAGARNARAKIEIYDAEGKEDRPGKRARFEGDSPNADKEVNSCYEFSLQIRKFYKEVHARNSIDGNGMKMISTVNFGNDFSNAFWDGVQCTYGRPGASSPFKTFVLLDIAAHEITHGVTQKDTDLEYYGQAGALNESLSDVYGSLIVQYSKHQAATKANWLVGDGIWKKGIKGRALRDMLKPGSAYDDPKVGKDPQPAHMKDYIKTRSDNGGVHYNSGIPNRAFATFAIAVGGNAWEEPGQIWYKARSLAGKNPSFAQFAQKTIEAAKSLGYENDIAKLKDAWNTVGVTPSASARDTVTPKLDGEQAQSTYY